MQGSGQQKGYNYDGRNVVRRPSVGGRGQRMSTVGPHIAAVVDKNNKDNNHHRGRGALCPPPLWSILSCRMLLVNIVDIVDRSRRWWHRAFGLWLCVCVCVFLASGYGWVTVMHEIPISSAHPLMSLPYPRTR
jgi:hypothetical protein